LRESTAGSLSRIWGVVPNRSRLVMLWLKRLLKKDLDERLVLVYHLYIFIFTLHYCRLEKVYVEG
jgi:hypothetical protein